MSEAERLAAFKEWYSKQVAEGIRLFGCTAIPVLQTETLNPHRVLMGAALDVQIVPNWTPPPPEEGLTP